MKIQTKAPMARRDDRN